MPASRGIGMFPVGSDVWELCPVGLGFLSWRGFSSGGFLSLCMLSINFFFLKKNESFCALNYCGYPELKALFIYPCMTTCPISVG